MEEKVQTIKGGLRLPVSAIVVTDNVKPVPVTQGMIIYADGGKCA